ncbi:MAG: primosomal protein N' [Lachnospiraceae bacterium]|nr:primosomal protein N' [Lachnospiraceae bacterium]
MFFADVIVDLSVDELDKTYQYKVPDSLLEAVKPGVFVKVPFGKGNRELSAIVLSISEIPKFDVTKIKDILSLEKKQVSLESRQIYLAGLIKSKFGGTLNDSLRVVLPVKKVIKQSEFKTLKIKSRDNAIDFISDKANRKKAAQIRIVESLLDTDEMPYSLVAGKIATSQAVKKLEEAGIIEAITISNFKDIVDDRYYDSKLKEKADNIILNEEQISVVNTVKKDFENGIRKRYLLHGITGSGKTEVYIEIIKNVIACKRKAIVLIPEIALTYQTVMRFVSVFGNRVSFLHSKLSQGERYAQYEKARLGYIDIMIGPRSALFTPFEDLGIIIIDEEHETSYKSESVPKYHAKDVAFMKADLEGASVLLGSATPSIESYYNATLGKYELLKLTKRAASANLPEVSIVDLRKELEEGNRSIFSRLLQEKIKERLDKKEQTMIFINRRGIAGFVSCRSCGEVIKCPHCDLSMTLHNNNKLICHYCNHTIDFVKKCPKCQSPFIGAFGIGTEKVEASLKEKFPQARVLRMDADTVKGNDGHEAILSEFRAGNADILVGTQMIVKGHDFDKVTLVGIISADLSLNINDYHAPERTFQLLAQASGRAGRRDLKGEVVIQTYSPEHYAVVTASEENYVGFYESEIRYRKLLKYPPIASLFRFLITSDTKETAYKVANELTQKFKLICNGTKDVVNGPTEPVISKIKDIFRYVVYVRTDNSDCFERLSECIENMKLTENFPKGVMIYSDSNPYSSY